ncbi:MAG: DUF4139 domain-containing protein [Methanosarcinales archaeon]|jgi:hypothetical protein|nr:DUF4139 domain-containing protein [Methanosarcinales archaeon]
MKNDMISSKIEEAAVFYSGAELKHTAAVSLVKGGSEIYVDGFSPSTDPKSVKIQTTNGVVVSSFEFSVNHLKGESLGEAAEKIKEEIKAQQKEYEKTVTEIRIHEKMSELLRESIVKKTTGPKKGADMDDLMKALDFFKTKSVELENALLEDREKSVLIRGRINDLSAQFNSESVKNTKTSGVLKLNLSSPADCDCVLTIRCYTANAGWYPYHDISAAAEGGPIKFVSKAKVRQTTGVDWEKVKMTLSTAVPSMGKTAPHFNALFLKFAEPPNSQKINIRSARYERSYDPAEEVSEDVIFAEECSKYGESSYSEPIYVIDGAAADFDYFSRIDPAMVKENVWLDSAAAAAIGYHAPGGAYFVTLKRSMEDFVTASDNPLNVTYDISLPYSVPGSGKEQSIELKSSEAPASFIYYSAPKLDSETYLIAEIADWENLNLLSGAANLSYDGTFLGETFINADSTQEKLSLTLGTDRRVAVKREKLREFSSRSLFGNDIKQKFAYRLTVRNNRTTAGRMILKDQYPISSDKEITVEVSKESTPFSADQEDIGVVTWEYDMRPGETKVFDLVYSVKYPKGKELDL